MTILVIGATGTTGSLLVDQLRDADHEVRAASRTPGLLADAVFFDWYAVDSWDAALHGVAGVYIVPPVGVAEPLSYLEQFYAAAQRNRVEIGVLLGASAIASGGPGVGRAYSMMGETFTSATVLRPSWFMDNFIGDHPQAQSLREHGEIVSATGGGKVGFIDARDIAAVARVALTSPQVGMRELLLTGPEMLSYDEVAQLISTESGLQYQHRSLTEHELLDELSGEYGHDFAAVLAGLDADIAAGKHAFLSPSVAEVTGVPPRSLRTFIRERMLPVVGSHESA